ncbi:MAG TPA: hypothetical protein VNY08_07230 [Bradyrhizobium sp.]|jgi:hypothetical protein|nr:hypothetical protein [Bradyrhizobium sp.]
MAGIESWKQRADEVARYRVLEQETTEPLAALLLRDIVLELEADLRKPVESADSADGSSV